jgi:hypothetical protein
MVPSLARAWLKGGVKRHAHPSPAKFYDSCCSGSADVRDQQLSPEHANHCRKGTIQKTGKMIGAEGISPEGRGGRRQ